MFHPSSSGTRGTLEHQTTAAPVPQDLSTRRHPLHQHHPRPAQRLVGRQQIWQQHSRIRTSGQARVDSDCHSAIRSQTSQPSWAKAQDRFGEDCFVKDRVKDPSGIRPTTQPTIARTARLLRKEAGNEALHPRPFVASGVTLSDGAPQRFNMSLGNGARRATTREWRPALLLNRRLVRRGRGSRLGRHRDAPRSANAGYLGRFHRRRHSR